MASMPRDSRVGNMKINKDRTSKIEMKYEWEQENWNYIILSSY